MPTSVRRLAAAIATVTLLPAVPVPSFAQAAIDEIVVTARLRQESLQDAPIAVTAVNEEQIRRYNLHTLQDISATTPNVEVAAGRTDGLFIRGIGSGGDTGFDQAVGIVIDDVFFNRGRWITQGFLDMRQVQILKGPQGVYLGKNSIAGAMVISTNEPTPEFEGSVRAGYEFNAKERFVEGVISGPLSETVGARLALRTLGQDGWMTNTHIGQDGPDKTEHMGRLTLQWTPTDDITNTLRINGARFKANSINAALQLVDCPQGGPQPVFGVIPAPGEDCQLNSNNTLNNTPPEFGDQFWKYKSWNLSNRLDWEQGQFVVTSITSLSNYDLEYLDDYDYSSADIIYAYEEEDYDQFSQELRLTSRLDGPINFLVGAHYERTKMYFRNASLLFNQTFFDVIAGSFGLPAGSFPLEDPRNGRSFTWDRDNNQKGRSWAAFAEVSFDILDNLRLDVGARYTDERKKSEAVNTFVNQSHAPFFGLEPEGAVFADTFSDSEFSPQATISWWPQEKWLLFASYKEGFKAGGFAHGTTLNAGFVVDNLTFESETVDGFEIGTKATLLDGRLQLGLLGFHYEFTNLQVNVFDSDAIAFTVQNAGENVTRGVEFDFRWNLTDAVSFDGAISHLDGEVKDFLGSCYAGQTVEAGCNQVLNPNTGAFSSQDLDGSTLPRAPRWSGSAGLTWNGEFGGGYGLAANTRLLWSDDYGLIATQRPGSRQSSYARWDANITLSGPDDRWQAMLYGKNLTNEKILISSTDRPGSGGGAGLPEAQGQSFLADGVSAIHRLREVGIMLNYRF